MGEFLQGAVIGFREGLEAFLIIVIIIQYLNKSKMKFLKKNVYYGTVVGILISVIIGILLYLISASIGRTGETAKLWESASSLLAVILVSTFIIWMIKNGRNMVDSIRKKTSLNLSASGLFILSAAMIAREGAEMAIFSFAGKYNVFSMSIGVVFAFSISVLIYFSLIRVNLRTIFNITLVYLILQAGFLLGYSIHEGLSAFKDLNILSSDSLIFIKAFDLSETVLNHKTGLIGLPLYVLAGWYSKPEWIQFFTQYIYTCAVFIYWYLSTPKTQSGRRGNKRPASSLQ